MENEYEIINNFYKINYLDTYYDFETKKLYLINCNENDIEVITELFNINRGTIFKYKDWGSHLSAFIKEIKSFSGVGRKYGVTDNAIKRRSKNADQRRKRKYKTN